MLSLLRVAVAASLLAQTLAISAPTCPDSANGYQVEKVFFLYKTFCNKLASTSFESRESFTGSATDPWISFGYEKSGSSSGCDEASCNSDYGSLLDACALRNHTVFGGGNVGTACGTYNFTIRAADFAPGKDGTSTPTTTLSDSPTGSAISSIIAVVESSFLLGPGTSKTSSSSVASVTAASTTQAPTSSSLGTSSSTTPSSTYDSASTSSFASDSSSSSPSLSISASSAKASGFSSKNSTLTTTKGPFGNATQTTVVQSGTGNAVVSVVWTTGSTAGGAAGASGTAAATTVKSLGSRKVVGAWAFIGVAIASGLLI